MIISLLTQMNHLHWLALGSFLLLGELFGAGIGYLLWMGISATLIGILVTVIPISWELQWLGFAFLTLFTTWRWWLYQHKKDSLADSHRMLNQKSNQLLGTQLYLTNPITQGKGRITLGDTTWSARSQSDIAAGTEVRITRVEGIVLTIEPVNVREETATN